MFRWSIAVMGKTLKARLPVNAEEQCHRRHSCIPQSIWIRFPNDRHDNSEADILETSGGETETSSSNGNDSDEDMIGGISNQTISVRVSLKFLYRIIQACRLFSGCCTSTFGATTWLAIYHYSFNHFRCSSSIRVVVHTLGQTSDRC
jgi:hypothetical protein